MKYEYKVFQTKSSWTGTYSDRIEEFLNDPESFKDGWEFVQVVATHTGSASILMRRLRSN